MKSIRWKRKLLRSGLLYVILDKKIIEEANQDILSLADKLAYYGTDILQLRAKNTCDRDLIELATRLTKIIRKRKKIFIVNDRTDIAYLSGADGLHIGKDDISPKKAKKILGKKMIIGKTAHSIKELICFQKEEINYIGIGPVFKTKIKPSLTPLDHKELKTMTAKAIKLTFAIGGINLYNITSLTSIGINNVALCRDIILCKDLKTAVKRYKKCLKRVL